ncbi:hypothetical protein HG531_009347 [Fusarium graminearum]|nr:hypothetical protein HG531_009347 [Fusarium graminearum]
MTGLDRLLQEIDALHRISNHDDPAELVIAGFLDLLSFEEFDHERSSSVPCTHDGSADGETLSVVAVRRNGLQVTSGVDRVSIARMLNSTDLIIAKVVECVTTRSSTALGRSNHDTDTDGSIGARNAGVTRLKKVLRPDILNISNECLLDFVDTCFIDTGCEDALSVLSMMMRQHRRNSYSNGVSRFGLAIGDSELDLGVTIPILRTTDITGIDTQLESGFELLGSEDMVCSHVVPLAALLYKDSNFGGACFVGNDD